MAETTRSLMDYAPPPVAQRDIVGTPARRMSIMDYLSKADLLNVLSGTGISERAGAINQLLNPVTAIGESMGASRDIFAPDRTMAQRIASTGDMLTGVAGAVVPMAAARLAGTAGANALAEGLLGGFTGAQKADTAINPIMEREFGKNWSDVYHWSRSPDEFEAFSVDKPIGSTSRLGPHVGTQKAAEDRFKAEVGLKGFTLPLKADLSRPFNNPSTDSPWGETELEAFVSAMADEHGIERRDVPPLMRRLLAEQGFTNIPYVNDVEDADSISNIMLTDRGNASNAVLRSRFAKFDPRHARSENLSAAIATGLPLGLMSYPQTGEERQ